MRLLLDTHALIWWMSTPDQLSARARALIEDPDNHVVLSAVSAYEIEYKRPRSAQLAALPADLEGAVADLGFAWLSLEVRHAVAAGRLSRLHGDPFDRFLAAVALSENLQVLTTDPKISAYGAPVIW